MTEKIYMLDIGGAFTKLGISTENEPRIVISSAIGTPKLSSPSISPSNQLFGTELDAFQGILHREGIFPWNQPKNLNLVFQFLSYTFATLNEETKGTNLILASSPEWSNDMIQQLMTFLFQELGFAAIYLQRSDFFDLIGHKIKSGVILNVGHYYSRITLYNNGKSIVKSGIKSQIAGRSIRQYLRYILHSNYPYLASSRYNAFLTEIVNTKCDLKINLEEFLLSTQDTKSFEESLEIPQFHDTLLLGLERFIAPEILFHPELMGIKAKGVDQLLIDSLKDCHPSLRSSVFQNIVIAGGASSYAYFPSILLNKCTSIPLLSSANILHHPKSNFTTWKGMQVAANPQIFEKYAKTDTQFFAKL